MLVFPPEGNLRAYQLVGIPWMWLPAGPVLLLELKPVSTFVCVGAPELPGGSWLVAPMTKRSRRSGVPFVPSQSCQFTGMVSTAPSHAMMDPHGSHRPGSGGVTWKESERAASSPSTES